MGSVLEVGVTIAILLGLGVVLIVGVKIGLLADHGPGYIATNIALTMDSVAAAPEETYVQYTFPKDNWKKSFMHWASWSPDDGSQGLNPTNREYIVASLILDDDEVTVSRFSICEEQEQKTIETFKELLSVAPAFIYNGAVEVGTAVGDVFISGLKIINELRDRFSILGFVVGNHNQLDFSDKYLLEEKSEQNKLMSITGFSSSEKAIALINEQRKSSKFSKSELIYYNYPNRCIYIGFEDFCAAGLVDNAEKIGGEVTRKVVDGINKYYLGDDDITLDKATNEAMSHIYGKSKNTYEYPENIAFRKSAGNIRIGVDCGGETFNLFK